MPEKRKVTGDRSPLVKTRKTVEHELKFHTYYIPKEVEGVVFRANKFPTREEENLNYDNRSNWSPAR